jgi:hypothetical protein
MQTVKVAVVTGGHSYDVPNFHRLWRSLPAPLDVYVQHLDDFASSPPDVRDGYDVALFYIMLRDGPTDEGLAWHQGKPASALGHLGETGQGIVVLHHGILAYPAWPAWSEMTGVPGQNFGYYMEQTVTTEIANPGHPVTRGLQPWTMVDETYTMPDAGPGSEVLLTYSHARSMRSIAWTRAYRQSRVFCYQAGHDNVTWQDPNFREVLRRGLLWSARRL